MLKQMINRPAIAMIELIFAIVIIGITLMSAPMLMQQATSSSYLAIQQEGINEVASKMNMIIGYHWDEGSSDPTIPDPIMITNGDNNLAEVLDIDDNGIGTILGTPQESERRFVDPGGDRVVSTSSNNLGRDAGEAAGEEDDIDDFNGTAGLVLIEASEADYIEDATTIDIVTTVAYISDAATAGAYNSDTLSYNPDFTEIRLLTSNIKRISSTLTSSSDTNELNKTITLHAFSCNIGSTKLVEGNP